MTKLFASLSLALVLVATGAPSASAAAFGIYRVPERFCESIRFDDQKYKPFVETHALSMQEQAELARDPIAREEIRRKKADRWGTQIVGGQKARCNGVSTYHD